VSNVNPEKAGVRPYLILLAMTVVSVIVLFLFPPIPQWASYHQFADVRKIWGIPNFWNVVSNAPFFLIGVLGFLAIKREWGRGNFVNWQEAAPFFVIFLGLILTAIGSSYYHLAPDNYRLVWDRIPMTLVFMGLLSLTIMERINFKAGFWLLFPLIAFGIGSVCYWIWTEPLGRGDLRPYGFAKFYSILAILIILYLFPKPYPSTKSFLLLMIFYGIATIFEFMDIQIYQMGGLISGHTLKHLFAAIGSYWLVVMADELETHLMQKQQTNKQSF
jgi:hypothetical protein